MKVYMFPGQGAQFKGMGEALFARFPERTEQADAVLGYSIRELCLEDPRDELSQTQFTQPALYVVNALSYFARLEDTGGGEPDTVLGHSLGEFSALMAAGCFDFETGLRLVRKRGELMGQVKNGGMAAILHASREEIEQTLRGHGLNNVYLANYNTPSQIVVSGLREEIAQAESLFQAYYPLATSGAFHTVFMRDAMEHFREYLQGVELAVPRIPVVANITARPYREDAVLDTLASQIANPVRWSESIQYLLALGRHRGQDIEFEELGPGEVLSRLVHGIRTQTSEEVLQNLMQAEEGNAAAEPHAATAGAVLAAPTVVALDRGLASADDKVVAWNARHPVGTRVRSSQDGYGDLETRTEAMVLFGHRAAVYVKGYNGYFDLDELVAA